MILTFVVAEVDAGWWNWQAVGGVVFAFVLVQISRTVKVETEQLVAHFDHRLGKKLI